MTRKVSRGAVVGKVFILLMASMVMVLSLNARIGNAYDSHTVHPHKVQLLSGRVTSIFENGIIQIRTAQGAIEEIEVTPDTIITPNGAHLSGAEVPDSILNPTGMGLKPGMKISVSGYRSGNAFSAETLHVSYY